MAKKFSELEAKMSPESRARVEEEVRKALIEIPLNELRNARGLSQKMPAEAWLAFDGLGEKGVCFGGKEQPWPHRRED
jgi:hypothetical protein